MTLPEPFMAYLPIVINDPMPTAGVQVDSPITIPVIPGRIYQVPARWMGIDAWFDANMQAVRGERTIIGTRTCPHPYRLWPEKTGSPPREDAYEGYLDFLLGLCSTYKPWAVEIWNEPGVPNTVLDDLQYYFGAWVEGSDFRGAGRRYGELVKSCYSWLHGIGTQVIAGGLVNTDETQLEFLGGFLETGQCDIVSFHCYLYQNDSFGKVYSSIEALRTTTDLPLIMNETAVITGSDDAPDSDSLQKRQVEYMRWLFEQRQYLDLPWLWYNAAGEWRQSGLKRKGIETPVYDTWVA